jgi:hypothetical protein
MEVQVNETTGNRRWVTNPNAHDDMAISAGMARWGLFDLPVKTTLKTAPKLRKVHSAPPSDGWT